MANAGYDERTEYAPTLSWSAIIAGSLVAVGSSVFFTLLAAGFGYDLPDGPVASPQSLEAFTPELGAGAVAIQVVSAGLGGYLAGRLRHAWTVTHPDEAHFRDTAQGLIVWALSSVFGLALAILVISPYAEQVASATIGAPPVTDAVRAAHIVAQTAFFAAVGMLLSAFVAAVAARVGGLQAERMHLKGR